MGQPPTLLWPWFYMYVYGFGHQIMGTSVRNVSLSGYFDLFDLRMKHVLGIVHAHIRPVKPAAEGVNTETRYCLYFAGTERIACRPQ